MIQCLANNKETPILNIFKLELSRAKICTYIHNDKLHVGRHNLYEGVKNNPKTT